jgi:UDP-glucose 4-epimerase
VELLSAGHDVVVVDNLSNSSQESLVRGEELAREQAVPGGVAVGALKFYQVDICDRDALDRVFDENRAITCVIHFAGLKAVGESVRIPLRYYSNNVTGTLVLLDAMVRHGVQRIIFSSSATVYGVPDHVPLDETAPLSSTNPYGRTKLFIEEILRDWCASDSAASCVLLRYFNPVGAHRSGRIGEDPRGVPNNLMPYVSRVAIGSLPRVSVFGNDYPTPDGTGVRDYIHITDLALGHLAALKKLSEPGCVAYNLGLGRGYSVLEMIEAMRKITGKSIPYVITDRRPGDVATVYADTSKAKRELGWQAVRGLEEMCRDLWCWQQQNPNGFCK